MRTTLLDRMGETVRHRLEDPASGRQWLAVTARWSAEAVCRQLEAEHRLTLRADRSFVVGPAAFVSTADGPVYVYEHVEEAAPITGPPAIAAFLRLAADAAEALAHIHGRRIVHRDIKPANLVRPVDGGVRWAGFRQALSLDDPEHEGARTPASDEALAYAAPEFARRAAPHADERSDLYALGVSLCEILTGEHPFRCVSPAEWLHAHIAIQPQRPSLARRDIPPILDAILLKLMAKDPARRYRSAMALHADLLRCLAAWSADGVIEAFELEAGAEPSLALADLLVGREAELAAMGETFGQLLDAGLPRMVLLAGPPGGGKSALTRAFFASLPPGAASFAVGKCEQQQRQTPYASIVQALRGLADDLLGQGRADLEAARERLIAALGAHARLVIELTPELELVIGKTSPVADLSAEAAQERMNATLLQTLAAFATRESPLVLFLDDLQWADESTWSLLRAFIALALPNLLLVGAYRDNERAQIEALEGLRSAASTRSIPVLELALSPLGSQDITVLTARALSCASEIAAPLAAVIHAKTRGNPFFAGQFLRALVDDQVVRFDTNARGWTWDLAEVAKRHHADDVIDLMVRRLDRLPSDTRTLLRLLAGVGSRADEALLAGLLAKPAPELRAQARPLLDMGLLQQDGGAYAFAHDRVLEAAYALTPAPGRPAMHAEIAMLMIGAGRQEQQDVVFEIANQIQKAASAPMDADSLQAFLPVLITAARRSKNAAAVDQAWDYLATAELLLGEEGWSAHYDAAFEVAFWQCQCLIQQVQLDQASAAIDRLIVLSRTDLHKAQGYWLRTNILPLRSDYEGAIVAALAGLSLLGVELQRGPSKAELLDAYDTVKHTLGDRTIASLADLPPTQNPAIVVSMDLLTALLASIFIDDGISYLHTAKIVELTILHGPSPASAHGLAWFGVFSAHHFGAYEEGRAFAETALALIERHGWERGRAGALVAADQVTVWTRPMSEALALARQAAAIGYTSGDLAMACYAGNHIVSDLLVMGRPMAGIIEEANRGLALARRIGFRDIERLIGAQLSYATFLSEGGYRRLPSDQRDDFSELGGQAVSQSTLFWEWLYRAATAFHFGDPERAAESLAHAGQLIWAVPANIDLAEFHLYAALTEAALARPDRTCEAIEAIAAHREKLAAWADLNPATFLGRRLLVDAELARLAGDAVAAMRLYEEAAAAGATNDLVQLQALAHELAAAHNQGLDLSAAARRELGAAREAYRRWGALGKVGAIEARHPYLVLDGHLAAPPATSGQAMLDAAVAMEAARTLSEEIVPDRLIEKLMRIMIVHAGAQYGLLLLMRDGEPVIQAKAQVVDRAIRVDLAVKAPHPDLIPMNVLNAVIRTRKPIVQGDAGTLEANRPSRRSTKRQTRSVICLPLIKQGELVGVLYLDNSLAAGVFTADRAAMLEMLAAQAAVSLETARLVAEVVEQDARRRQSEAALRTARAELSRTSHLTAMGGLAASIAHEINQPLATIQTHAGAGLRWLSRGVPDVEEARASLQDIETSAQRASAIVKGLRALAYQTNSNLSPVSIDGLIGEVLELTVSEVEAKAVDLAVTLDAGEAAVTADPVQLQQVVLNLVTNGVDAMAGLTGRSRRLSVASWVEDDLAVITVTDTGAGISDAALDRIFDPLFTTKSSGMGMGLAICRSIVEAHHGWLEVAATSQDGTTFRIKLPLAGQA
jgi:predicted ATPase/signal transduction histidine kinase